MVCAKRIDSYSQEVMINIIHDVMKSNWPEEFKKHILLKELLWKRDSPRGVKGDNSEIIFSAKARALWQSNEDDGLKNLKSGIVIEHAVPRLEIYAALSKVKPLSKKSISDIMRCMIVRVAVTMDEDKTLNSLGLRQKMPENWDGCNPLARHQEAGIKHVKWKPEKYKTKERSEALVK